MLWHLGKGACGDNLIMIQKAILLSLVGRVAFLLKSIDIFICAKNWRQKACKNYVQYLCNLSNINLMIDIL